MAKQSARELAIAALREWRTGKQFADSILRRRLSACDLAESDRAFVTELFYGVLRNLTLLDFWIDSLRSGKLDHSTRDLLRLGLYQLFLIKIPEHAAVNETVNLANTKVRSLVNAVLRNAARERDHLVNKANIHDLDVRESHPQFLISRWEEHFGKTNAEALCQWNNRPSPVYARINLLKTSTDEFLSVHPDAERLTEQTDFVRLSRLPAEALARGECYIQDPSTALACALLAPLPGERLLDACAAPGGKTGYLAQMMKNEGVIIACDRDRDRIKVLQGNLERLGVSIAEFEQHDWISGKSNSANVTAASFDRILVDAPCSNTGVMRRRVDLRWRLTAKDFSQMYHQQVFILRSVIPLLKPAGVLVYSTCSIEPDENEDVIKFMKSEFPFLTLEKQVTSLPFRDGFDGAFAARFHGHRLHPASLVE
jgi:16S rRNA (cytosine967-C5)-methyltransferase